MTIDRITNRYAVIEFLLNEDADADTLMEAADELRGLANDIDTYIETMGDE